MNYLVDTHLLIWAAGQDDKLSPEAVEILNSLQNNLWFSVASFWEIAIKKMRNRPDFKPEIGPLRAGLFNNGYSELAVEGHHVLLLSSLPPIHKDPFDRLLLAQAAAAGLVLLTSDRTLGEYGGDIRLV